ncbi:hypothetical protein RRG08_062591 [Elysia crispata]|uniref:Uncharacterized protein n=1 Tax=Elysia crispata TaxID=231223 RepID=A0AAE0YYB4_9GAST|nr:hypothetical protein RRG08_062591 [Elysia crispata]
MLQSLAVSRVHRYMTPIAPGDNQCVASRAWFRFVIDWRIDSTFLFMNLKFGHEQLHQTVHEACRPDLGITIAISSRTSEVNIKITMNIAYSQDLQCLSLKKCEETPNIYFSPMTTETVTLTPIAKHSSSADAAGQGQTSHHLKSRRTPGSRRTPQPGKVNRRLWKGKSRLIRCSRVHPVGSGTASLPWPDRAGIDWG